MPKLSAGNLFRASIVALGLVLEALGVPPIITGLVWFVAVGLMGTAAWKWAGQFNYQHKAQGKAQRWRLQAALSGLIWTLGIVLFAFYHRLVPTAPGEQEALLERYRRLVESTDLPNETALIEWSNRELRTRALNIVPRMKAMISAHGKMVRQLQARRDAKEITEDEYGRLWTQELSRAGQEFDKDLRVDARMLLMELRNRIPYQARKHIVGLPSLRSEDERGGSVSLYDLFPADFGVGWAELLAREIEELAKLLPER